VSTHSDHSSPHLNASDCDELRELLPAYMIGATTADEAQQVEQLLPLCPEVADEMGLYATLTEGLTAQVERVAPPAHARKAFLDRVAAEERALKPLPQKAPIAMPVPAPRGRSAWVAAAAVLALLVATNAYWLARVNTLEQDFASAEEQKQTIVTLLNAERIQRISLQSTSTTNTEMLARVFWNPETRNGTFYTDRFPTLDEAHTYQVWLIKGDEPISAGTFEVDDTGEGLLTFTPGEDLSSFAAIAISVEPVGGSAAPTTDPMALGEIAAS
jgi:anti-sigma-K factor RskA